MEWITVFILLGVFNSSLGLFNYEFKTKFYLNESRVIQAESSCECRNLCLVDKQCELVSWRQLDDGSIECLSTNQTKELEFVKDDQWNTACRQPCDEYKTKCRIPEDKKVTWVPKSLITSISGQEITDLMTHDSLIHCSDDPNCKSLCYDQEANQCFVIKIFTVIPFEAKEKEEGDILCEVTSENNIITSLDEFNWSTRQNRLSPSLQPAFTGLYFGKVRVQYLFSNSISWFAVDLSPKIKAPAMIKVYDHTNRNNALKILMMDYLPENNVLFSSLDTKYQVQYQTEQGTGSTRFSVLFDADLASENRKVLLVCNDIVDGNNLGHVTVELI